jgi:hypothetical protein
MPTVAVPGHSASPTASPARRVVVDPAADSAAQAWAALVPLMSADRWMLVSLDGGKSYRRRGRRLIGPKPPPQPAAIPIYDGTGRTRVLVVDLDTSKTSPGVVLRDLAAVERLFQQAGGRVIVDRSPSGGHHVYLPLADPLVLGEAKALSRAIAKRWPSVDPTPMLNAQTGVIRPPGSLYKRGQGYQELVTPLAVAYDVLRRPAAASVVQMLQDELEDELAALARAEDMYGSLSDDFADAPWQPLPGGPRDLTARYGKVAATGVYDTARYGSPSEARQAVLCSAAAAGMRLSDVASRMESGLWAGLNSFYQRYHARNRRKALVRDWREADRYVRQQRAQTTDQTSVRHCDTRGPDTHRGAGETRTYQDIRIWTAAVDEHAPDQLTPDQHMLLRTLAEAAQKTGSMEVEFGVRSLSVAAGKRTHQALAKNLAALRSQADPFIELVEQHQGVVADRYRLRLPARYEEHQLRSRSRRRGTIHGIRAPFRELGAIAALTYEALETAPEPLTGRGIASTLRRSPEAISGALAALAGWDLAQRVHGRWELSPRADLNRVAEALGVLDEIHDQLQRIRAERLQWWNWLGVRRLHAGPNSPTTQPGRVGSRVQQHPDTEPPEPPDDPWPPEWDTGWNPHTIPAAPAEDEQLTMLRLLEQMLDARPLARPGRRSAAGG